jgi:hypothetical protein
VGHVAKLKGREKATPDEPTKASVFSRGEADSDPHTPGVLSSWGFVPPGQDIVYKPLR